MISTLREGPKGRTPEVRNSYRYLRGAHSSVSGLLDVVQTLAGLRRTENSTTVGRMKTEEVDLLRAAIMFTSSGLDASMKRLVLDGGRFLIGCEGSGAQAQYVQGLKEMLSAKTIDAGLKAAITRPDAAEQILKVYLSARTKSSFQGSGDLKARVRSTLGISAKRVTDEALESLDGFFIARNSIAHSMDYSSVGQVKSTARIHRSVEDVTKMCGTAFSIAADLIHACAETIQAGR